MIPPLSPNTQAILLLTAPLIAGRGTQKAETLRLSEYNRLAQRIREVQCEPAHLLEARSAEDLQAYKSVIDLERLQRLLARGFQLSQVVERWHSRAIWVISRSDPAYPQRLKVRLGSNAPALLYGCGELDLLSSGGLAVVGSRAIPDDLVEYTMEVGRLAARAGRSIISGGAKGTDQAAMRGALEAGGYVCGVLADSLEKQAMVREHRNMLLDGQLVLVSTFDPNASFHVGNAMQRNKFIYALADAALVVSSGIEKSGTWAGATEQLDKFRFVPLYVRSTGEPSPGLNALRGKGALAWPNPATPDTFDELLKAPMQATAQRDLSLIGATAQENAMLPKSHDLMATDLASSTRDPDKRVEAVSCESEKDAVNAEAPAEVLFAVVRGLILQLLSERPLKDTDVADALQVSTKQAKEWLERLVNQGSLEKTKKPSGYAVKVPNLFA